MTGVERVTKLVRGVVGDHEEPLDGDDDDAVRSAVRHIILPGNRRFRAPEVWQRAGVEEATARDLWRAMGFPQAPDGAVSFSDADVDALRLAAQVFDRADLNKSVALQQARTMSQAAGRVAAAHQDVIASLVPLGNPEALADQADKLADSVLPALDQLLVYLYRRHLAAATEQTLLLAAVGSNAATMTVGFADLVGFTALAQQLDEPELAELVERFNATTADVVAEAGGRVVKTIGDAVMFCTSEPGAGAAIALRLLDAGTSPSKRPALRVGLAAGPVITREGDLFGPTVNLASRLVAIARPDSVMVDEAVSAALEGDERFELRPTRPRKLKGIGKCRLFRLRPACGAS